MTLFAPRAAALVLTLFSATGSLRAQPAVPLVTLDPYISVWSLTDRLTDDWPKHWTNNSMGVSGMVRVDGKAFRWCGPTPRDIPAAQQLRRDISPTTTTFTFAANNIELTVLFHTPVEPDLPLAKLATPVSTISFSASTTDTKPHNVEVYIDLSGEWCSDSPNDQVSWSRLRASDLDVISMGTTDQPQLRAVGDWKKIDWGRVYLAADHADAQLAASGHDRSRMAFARKGEALDHDDARMPRAVSDDWPVLAAVVNLGRIVDAPSKNVVLMHHVVIGYDDVRSIELFERPLRPLWACDPSADILSVMRDARKELSNPAHQPASDRLVAEATRVGGPEYTKLVTLAYRQVLAGHKLACDWDGTPLMFAKENTSNGCISTVDVIYPASPFYLYHDPEMLKASLRPLLMYAASPRWKFPFAPHDLGTYPKANGQVYGGGESTEDDQMPVEESGNMLIMLGALAMLEGNSDFSKPYLPMLEKWATYLQQNGLDPANQLCTDDFAGHLARNANLSAKTCVALGAYAELLRLAGHDADAKKWHAVAQDFAQRWTTLAAGSSATVLVFGGPADKETWSQKYNLVWDKVLGLKLFPDSIFEREMAFYKTHLKTYGLPLDSRMTYTKLDWSTWTACLTVRRSDFDAIMKPTYDWLNASPPPSRVPLPDWYETTDGKNKGMFTRTVVGGVWMPLLMQRMKTGW